jgi:hypothetical protein
MKPPSEPHNPFYLLLLVASVVFVATALAYGVLPVLEDLSERPPPPSPLRAAVREHGWWWLLVELAVMMVLALASMGLDRLRSLQKEKNAVTIPPSSGTAPSPATEGGNPHEQRGEKG